MNADPQAKVEATFDYDSYGSQLSGAPSFKSGSDKEQDQTVYTYTGMREAGAGGTTNHHARDYNATLRQWLQTDQYLDPMSDLGLSTDPTTRERGAYTNNNPIAMVDQNGHCEHGFGLFCPADSDPTPDTTAPTVTTGSPGNQQPVGPAPYNPGQAPPSPSPRIAPGQPGYNAGNPYRHPSAQSSASYSRLDSAVLTMSEQYSKRGQYADDTVAFTAKHCGTGSSIVLGSNACNGVGKGESVWIAANVGSYFIGIGEVRTTAAAVTKGVAHFGGEDAIRGAVEICSRGCRGARFTEDQAALVDLAKGAKRSGGLTPEDAMTMEQWAAEVGIPFRGPEIHPNRNFDTFHVHLGPVDHLSTSIGPTR